MNVIKKFLKKNARLILHILCTGIICPILAILFNQLPDYRLIGNILLVVLIVYCMYRIIFKGIYTDSVIKLICIFAMLIATNRLYSYEVVISLFPFLSNIKQEILVAIVVLMILVILMILKIITYIKPVDLQRSNIAPNNATNENEHVVNDLVDLNISNRRQYAQTDLSTIRQIDPNTIKAITSFLQFLVFLFVIFAAFIIPTLYIYSFNKNNINISTPNFNKLIPALISYGIMILFFFFAFVIISITLIHLAKYLYGQITSFKSITDKEGENYHMSSYALSVIIVFTALFIFWKDSNLTIYRLTDKLVIGDYLAIPLAVLIGITAFLLLVQITHIIILFFREINFENIRGYIKKYINEFQIKEQIIEIARDITKIVLGTITVALQFVLFIPSFFKMIKEMVFDDEDDICDGSNNM